MEVTQRHFAWPSSQGRASSAAGPSCSRLETELTREGGPGPSRPTDPAARVSKLVADHRRDRDANHGGGAEPPRGEVDPRPRAPRRLPARGMSARSEHPVQSEQRTNHTRCLDQWRLQCGRVAAALPLPRQATSSFSRAAHGPLPVSPGDAVLPRRRSGVRPRLRPVGAESLWLCSRVRLLKTPLSAQVMAADYLSSWGRGPGAGPGRGLGAGPRGRGRGGAGISVRCHLGAPAVSGHWNVL